MARKAQDHRWMRVWQNADRLDTLVQQVLKRIPRYEFELRRQIDSASDSIGANFVEGYYSGSLAEYMRFVRYSKRSTGELRERIRRAWRKDYVTDAELEQVEDLAIKTMYLFDRLLFALKQKSLEPLPSRSRPRLPSSTSQALSSLLKPS
jgi:four helix bundle protein